MVAVSRCAVALLVALVVLPCVLASDRESELDAFKERLREQREAEDRDLRNAPVDKLASSAVEGLLRGQRAKQDAVVGDLESLLEKSREDSKELAKAQEKASAVTDGVKQVLAEMKEDKRELSGEELHRMNDPSYKMSATEQNNLWKHREGLWNQKGLWAKTVGNKNDCVFRGNC